MPQQKERSPLLGRNNESAAPSKIPVAFPREFRQREVFTIVFNLVVGLGFYIGAGTILATGGEGSMMMALLFLGLLIVAVNQDVVRMLRIWPIDMNLVIFVHTFIDPHLGIVIGWLPYVTYCCCFAVSAVITSTLVDLLVDSKAVSVLVKFTTIAVPVVLNLMATRYFKNFQLGLAAIKMTVVVAIFSIMLYINPSVAQPPRKLVSKEDLVFPGTGLHEHFAGLMFAMYKLTASFIGVEAISLIASETKPKRHRNVEEQVSINSACSRLQEFR
jgi:amino acid permease